MINFTRLVALAALAAGAVQLPAAEPATIEQRLDRLEAALQRIEAKLGDTVSADELAPALKEYSDLTHQLVWDGKSPLTVAKAGGKEQKISVGGYLQLNGELGDAPDARFNGIFNRFYVRRARLTVKGTFAENIDFNFQTELGNNAIANNAASRAQLTDAFVTWNKYDEANLNFGQFKIPFGYEQLQSDTKIATIERSLPNDQLTLGRQIGLDLAGTAADKRINYAVGVFNGNGANNGGNDNDQFLSVARVGVTPWRAAAGKLTVAVDGYQTREGATAATRVNRTAWGADTQFTSGPFELDAEYLSMHLDRLIGTDTTADGWSVQGSWFFPGKIFQAVTRYETYDANTALSANTSATWVFGLNYFLKGDDLKLSLDYLDGDPAGPLKNQGRFLGRMQVIF